MRPAGWKVFGHAMFKLSQLNVTEVAEFVQRNFQNFSLWPHHPVNKYESCRVSRKAGPEALTGAHVGGVLSREISGNQGADDVRLGGRQHWGVRYGEHSLDLARSKTPAC